MTSHPAKKTEPTVANRQAFRNYKILERCEAGIGLSGTEIKSVRNGKVDLGSSFACADQLGLVLRDVHIPPYEQGNRFNHNPTRPRRLLLHAREIRHLSAQIRQKGLTLVPLKLYFKNGWAKVELGLCKGKNMADKRDTMRQKTADREASRAMSNAMSR